MSSLICGHKCKYELQIKGLILIVESTGSASPLFSFLKKIYFRKFVIVNSFCFFEMTVELVQMLVSLLPALRHEGIFLKDLGIILKYIRQGREGLYLPVSVGG